MPRSCLHRRESYRVVGGCIRWGRASSEVLSISDPLASILGGLVDGGARPLSGSRGRDSVGRCNSSACSSFIYSRLCNWLGTLPHRRAASTAVGWECARFVLALTGICSDSVAAAAPLGRWEKRLGLSCPAEAVSIFGPEAAGSFSIDLGGQWSAGLGYRRF